MGARARHADDAVAVMRELFQVLVCKRAAVYGHAALSFLALRFELDVAGLQDEARDDAVELAILVGQVVLGGAEGAEVFAGARIDVGAQLDYDAAGWSAVYFNVEVAAGALAQGPPLGDLEWRFGGGLLHNGCGEWRVVRELWGGVWRHSDLEVGGNLEFGI